MNDLLGLTEKSDRAIMGGKGKRRKLFLHRILYREIRGRINGNLSDDPVPFITDMKILPTIP